MLTKATNATWMAHLFGGLFALCVLFGFVSFADALTVAPARLELSANPGEVVTGEFLLINEQDEQKTFYSSYQNFEAQGETGTPNFVDASEGLGTWIRTADSMTIGPGEQVEVPFTINVPTNAEPGGNFAAIFWGTTPSDDGAGSQVSVGAQVGILVLLRVNGDIEEGGGIVSFTTRDERAFFSSLPIGFEYRFTNSGGDRIKPEGEITIRNTFGFKTETISANKTEGNILPQSTRKFDATWDGGNEEALATDESPLGFFGTVSYQAQNFAIGRYSATLDLSYGAEGLTDNARLSFFVFPWQLLIVVIVMLLALFMVSKKVLLSYNKSVVERARKEWEVKGE